MSHVNPGCPSSPSVSFAPPQLRNNRSSRLPAYHSLYMGRYHPYPRAAPGQCQDRLMTTVDYRYGTEPLWEEPAIESYSDSEEDSDGANTVVEAAPLDSAPSTTAADHSGPWPTASVQSQSTMVSPLSRSKLIVALSDALTSLRRRYLSCLAVKSFLKNGGLTKGGTL
ncbi:hypothetical protein C8Q78DRAFT_1079321 [Trametes maxima]|nr:hypothetical protein C8Q78DRAFT_1079321 [Trametes maxima]